MRARRPVCRALVRGGRRLVELIRDLEDCFMPTSPTRRQPMRTAGKLVTAAVSATALLGFMVGTASAPAAASAPAKPAERAQFEISFMKEMSMHHHMAVMMAAVCTERTDIRQRLVDYCGQIVVDQNREVNKMLGWLRNWYGIEYDPMADMDEEEMSEMITMMQRMSGPEFEVIFLEDMIVHHSTAMPPARECQRKAAHFPLQQLCFTIVDAQQAEIRMMRTMLCNWYDKCTRGPAG